MDTVLFIALSKSTGHSNSTPTPPLPPSGRPTIRRRTALIAITAVLVVICIGVVIWISNRSSSPTTSAPYEFHITALDARIIPTGFGGDYLEVTIKGETTSFQVTVYGPDGKQMGWQIATPNLNGEAKVNIYAGYSHKTGTYTIELSRYLTETYRKEIYIP